MKDELPVWAGKHYSVGELAVMWGLCKNSITKLFRDEPGIVKICPPHRKGKRTKTTLRIPASIVERVYQRCIKK
jgi:hypothetical protein